MSGPSKDPSTPECPVDPAARSKWLSILSFGDSTVTAAPASASAKSPEACPVDSAARARWLSQQTLNAATPPGNTAATTTATGASCGGSSSTLAAASSSSSSSSASPQLPPNHPPPPPPPLARHREVSSIPRAADTAPNSEHMPATAATSARNWIYPSEEMFFAAMKRKALDPQAADMRTVVPIHNAVNERAWMEIKRWEEGRGSERCGGPKLASFSGDSSKLTPKARLLTMMGYHPPFDRHDWTVDRCGKKVEYVIDFYSGKRDPSDPAKVSFYLDVRPKISFEGVRMRVGRWMAEWF